MKAIVVYESLWGNTAAIARAIAEGSGPGPRHSRPPRRPPTPRPVPTSSSRARRCSASACRQTRCDGIGVESGETRSRPISRPLDALVARGVAARIRLCAGFETRIWWSPGSAAKTIASRLEAGATGRRRSRKFLVTGKYGPLKDGEIERARAWGAELAKTVG